MLDDDFYINVPEKKDIIEMISTTDGIHDVVLQEKCVASTTSVQYRSDAARSHRPYIDNQFNDLGLFFPGKQLTWTLWSKNKFLGSTRPMRGICCLRISLFTMFIQGP